MCKFFLFSPKMEANNSEIPLGPPLGNFRKGGGIKDGAFGWRQASVLLKLDKSKNKLLI